jgi:thiosulfate/3-mercaptopyruvate sulfurtransferase
MRNQTLSRRSLLQSVALSTAVFISLAPVLIGGVAQATESAVSAKAIQYERDWIIQPKAARELIDAGAVVVDARGTDLKDKSGLEKNSIALVWQDLSQPDLPTKGRLIDDDAALTKKLQGLGLAKDTPVVVLGDPANGWGEDGRIAWTLKTLGLNKVVIVDGGLPALKKLGALSIKPLKIPGDFVVARTNKWEVRKEELRDRIAQKNTVIFDVREQREYEGKTPYGESRGGHVPGAKGLWYKDLIAKDGQLLPRAEIEKVLASKGVTKDSEIVSYCTGGIRSGWFTTLLNDLGYKAKNYAGSMWEWSAQAPAQYPLTTN